MSDYSYLQLAATEKLFENVKYFTSGNVSEQALKLLEDGGGQHLKYFSDFVSHVICGTSGVRESDLLDANDLYEVPAVTERWIFTCCRAKKVLNTKGFLYNPKHIFSSLTMTTSQLNKNDQNAIWAMVTYHGGSFQRSLDHTVTHLITTSTSSQKYQKCLTFGSKVIVATTDWIVECVKQKKLVAHEQYHPRLMVLYEKGNDMMRRSDTSKITGFEPDNEEPVDDPEETKRQVLIEKLWKQMPWNQPSGQRGPTYQQRTGKPAIRMQMQQNAINAKIVSTSSATTTMAGISLPSPRGSTQQQVAQHVPKSVVHHTATSNQELMQQQQQQQFHYQQSSPQQQQQQVLQSPQHVLQSPQHTMPSPQQQSVDQGQVQGQGQMPQASFLKYIEQIQEQKAKQQQLQQPQQHQQLQALQQQQLRPIMKSEGIQQQQLLQQEMQQLRMRPQQQAQQQVQQKMQLLQGQRVLITQNQQQLLQLQQQQKQLQFNQQQQQHNLVQQNLQNLGQSPGQILQQEQGQAQQLLINTQQTTQQQQMQIPISQSPTMQQQQQQQQNMLQQNLLIQQTPPQQQNLLQQNLLQQQKLNLQQQQQPQQMAFMQQQQQPQLNMQQDLMQQQLVVSQQQTQIVTQSQNVIVSQQQQQNLPQQQTLMHQQQMLQQQNLIQQQQLNMQQQVMVSQQQQPIMQSQQQNVGLQSQNAITQQNLMSPPSSAQQQILVNQQPNMTPPQQLLQQSPQHQSMQPMQQQINKTNIQQQLQQQQVQPQQGNLLINQQHNLLQQQNVIQQQVVMSQPQQQSPNLIMAQQQQQQQFNKVQFQQPQQQVSGQQFVKTTANFQQQQQPQQQFVQQQQGQQFIQTQQPVQGQQFQVQQIQQQPQTPQPIIKQEFITSPTQQQQPVVGVVQQRPVWQQQVIRQAVPGGPQVGTRVQWQPGQQPPVQRQYIHLDAQTHQQLQQMAPEERAQFVDKLRKQRQFTQRQQQFIQLQQQRGGHILIRSNTPVPQGLTPQQQMQWLQQAKQQGVLLQSQTVQQQQPGLSPIQQQQQQQPSPNIVPQVQGQQTQFDQQVPGSPQTRPPLRVHQLQLQRDQAKQQPLLQQQQQQQQQPAQAQQAPVQGQAQGTVQSQQVDNNQTTRAKTALANMLSIRLSGGQAIAGEPNLSEPSAAGTLRLMTAQHNASLNTAPNHRAQQILALHQQQQQRRLNPPGQLAPVAEQIRPTPVQGQPAQPPTTPTDTNKLQYSPRSVLPIQHRPGTFYGHNPNLKLPSDLFLLGCIFVVVEIEDDLNEKMPVWSKKIETYGGEIEKQYCTRVTHVLCKSQRHGVVMQALRDYKRCVTIYWLHDVLERKQVLPPWMALHLPTMNLDSNPATKHLITLTGFLNNDRERVKVMIENIGAGMTTYLSQHNTLLVSADQNSRKCIRAKKWGIPIVNVQWLTEVMLGNFSSLNQTEHVKYQQVSEQPNFCFDPSLVPNLMQAWKMPINISQESYERVKRSASPVALPKAKKIKTENQSDESQSEDQLKEKECKEEHLPQSTTHRILLSSRCANVKELREIILQLGGSECKDSSIATHFIVSKLLVTFNLVSSICQSVKIVSEAWLLESKKSNTFIDETPFVPDAKDFNHKHNCDFNLTMTTANRNRLFEGRHFFVTPNVCQRKNMLALIRSCGGTVERVRRSMARIDGIQLNSPYSYIIVADKKDLHLVGDLLKRPNKIVCCKEIIFSAIFKQTFEVDPYLIQIQPPKSEE